MQIVSINVAFNKRQTDRQVCIKHENDENDDSPPPQKTHTQQQQQQKQTKNSISVRQRKEAFRHVALTLS